MATMTDSDVVCTWMEPKPTSKRGTEGRRQDLRLIRWWIVGANDAWVCWSLSLDRLREVEAKLSDSQFSLYAQRLAGLHGSECVANERAVGSLAKAWIHADVPTKLLALAAVLRSEVKA